MNITNGARKVDEKMMPFVWFPFFLPELWSLNFPKFSLHLFLFVLTSARNLNLLQQFIQICLKDLTKLSQKVVCFIGVWLTVHEILKNKMQGSHTSCISCILEKLGNCPVFSCIQLICPVLSCFLDTWLTKTKVVYFIP